MSRYRMFLFAVIGILASSMTAFAQVTEATGAGDNANSVSKYRALAAGIGFAIAVFGGALGQSRIGAAACEGAARNPGAAGRIQTMMILGLALIESLVLFALLLDLHACSLVWRYIILLLALVCVYHGALASCALPSQCHSTFCPTKHSTPVHNLRQQ